MADPLPVQGERAPVAGLAEAPNHPERGIRRRLARGRSGLPAVPALMGGWVCVAAGINGNDGRGSWPLAFSLAGLLLVAGGCLALARTRRHRGGPVLAGEAGGQAQPEPTDGVPGRAAWYLVAAAVAAGAAHRPRYYATGRWAAVSDITGILAAFLAAAAIVAWAAPGQRAGRSAAGRLAAATRGPGFFGAALALATVSGVTMILAAPVPRIDVWYLLQGSGRGLLHGADMYRQSWAPSRVGYPVPGLFDVYPYLPVTTVALLPARLLLGDVRYGLLAALLLAAVLIRRTGAGRAAPPALGLLVVLFPESMYALQQAWTEPLLVAALAGAVVAISSGRRTLAVVCVAAALGSKQHVALLLPLLAAWPAFGPRRALAAAGLAAAAVAPWVAAGPGDFWHDAVRVNLDYPVLANSLSVPGWLDRYGITLGFAPIAVVLAASYLLAWRPRGDAAGFCAGSALVLLTLDVMNKQSFFNHYTLPMGLLVLTVAALDGGPGPGAPAAPEPAGSAARP